jgi:starch-binding outer membrane protein, SusD/RagB family
MTMKRNFVTSALLVVVALACTDLSESPPSAISPGNFYRNDAEVLAGLAGVYAQLRSTLDDYYNVSEISTDEMIVPTRGNDWYDGGTWLDLHAQTWTPTSPATGAFLGGAWNVASGGIARANVLLDALQTVSVANQATITAETRVLRAYYYYIMMDLFGGVPIATSSVVEKRPSVSRDSLFKFVESELLAARADLPVTWSAGNNGRVTRGVVDALLASMYINAGVFTKDGAAGGISATAYNSCTGVTVAGPLSACQAALNRADSVLLSSAGYQLADTFAKVFRSNNANNPEHIFVVKFIPQDGLGLNFVMRALHYKQFTPEPWNGFATIAQTYDAFDSLDRRRQIFLIGPQYDVLTGDTACVRPGCDQGAPQLVFTKTINNITQATEGEGARIYKYPADPAHVAQNNGNDFVLFRLAEMNFIKAEALLNGATGSSTPLALIRAVRARAFATDTLSAVTLPVILRERLFEFTGEGKRRQDLIRFGAYTAPWQFKTTLRPDHYVLMPIPQGQIDANEMLTQNPGY